MIASLKLKEKAIVTNWEVLLFKIIALFPLSLLPFIGIVMLYTGHTKLPPPISTKLFSFS